MKIPSEILNFKEKKPKKPDFTDFDTTFVSKLYGLIESRRLTVDEDLPDLHRWFKAIIEANKQATLIFFLRTHNTWKEKQENIPG